MSLTTLQKVGLIAPQKFQMSIFIPVQSGVGQAVSDAEDPLALKLLNIHAHLRKPKSISFTFMKGGPKGFWLDHLSLFQGLLSCSFLFGLVLTFISFLATHRVIPLGG